MKTKDRLLTLFELNRGVYLSGEDIAQTLDISRTAIWKAVKALQQEGYAIKAVTNKGYCFGEQNDILSAQGMQKYLHPEQKEIEISVLQTVSSTNTVVQQKVSDGARTDCLILANEQTQGRGRAGRSFFSPKDTGIYMSLLLCPKNCSANQASQITTMAAVAMCEAIETICEEKAQIKWVNDIFLRGKKVCGILTEASFSLESGLMEYAVLGIGVNLYPPKGQFPKELQTIAGSIFQEQKNDAKNQLVAQFLNHFFAYYSRQSPCDYVQKYRDRSFVIGKQVQLIAGNQSDFVTVVGIDDQCRLLIRYNDGKECCCSAGEINIRLNA